MEKFKNDDERHAWELFAAGALSGILANATEEYSEAGGARVAAEIADLACLEWRARVGEEEAG